MHIRMNTTSEPMTPAKMAIPQHHRPALLPVARRAFWWGEPEEWLEDAVRFTAQVMTYCDWDDTVLTLKVLGNDLFRQVLRTPPPGVFDLKSWTYWHHHYGMKVPQLPARHVPAPF
jgi:hypothetical protein